MADPSAIDAVIAALPAGSTSWRFAPDEALLVGWLLGRRRRPGCHRRGRGRLRRRVRRSCAWSSATPSGRCPAAGAVAQGSIAGVPCKLAWLPDGQAWVVTHAAYVDELAGPSAMSEYTDSLSPIRWADEPKSSYDVVIIGGGGHGLSTAYHLATRHGITNVAVLEADYIAERQHRPQHDDHPRELRHPRVDPLLPALARALPGARGRDRRRDPPPDQGHRLARPHRDGDADRAGARRDEPGLRRADVHAHAGRAQGADPAARPDRRRPLPGARRLASRRGRDRAPRPGRVGVRQRRGAPWRRPVPAHAGDGDPARRAGRARHRRRDAAGPDRGRRRAVAPPADGSPRSRRWPASACRSGPTRSTRS